MKEAGGLFTRWYAQYLLEYLIALLLFVGAAAVCTPLARAALTRSSKLLWMFPVVATLLLLALVVFRHFRRIDEFLRRFMLDSFAAVGVCALVGALLYAMLEVAGFPRISMWWVWGGAVLVWNARALLAWTIRR